METVRPGVEINGKHSATYLITLLCVVVLGRTHVCETMIKLILQNNMCSVIIY